MWALPQQRHFGINVASVEEKWCLLMSEVHAHVFSELLSQQAMMTNRNQGTDRPQRPDWVYLRKMPFFMTVADVQYSLRIVM